MQEKWTKTKSIFLINPRTRNVMKKKMPDHFSKKSAVLTKNAAECCPYTCLGPLPPPPHQTHTPPLTGDACQLGYLFYKDKVLRILHANLTVELIFKSNEALKLLRDKHLSVNLKRMCFKINGVFLFRR